MVDQFGGAFVADVVGVGKTFVGSAVARFYYESERRRPLIICPHALVEMWQKYNIQWHLNATIIPTSLLRENADTGADNVCPALGEEMVQDCRFILIDESHNFRYSDSQRYHILSDFLMDGSDRKVLLLTATPYNKSPLDVYNQIKLFHHEEITRMPIEPRNLRQYFRRVEEGERRLSDLLVHLLVRRTRWQLLRWYGFDALELAVKDKRRVWKAQKASIERQVRGLQEQVSRLQQKKRQYSWQQAEGIITEEELLTACRQIQSEERIIKEQLIRLEKFKREPSPPDMATFKKLAEYWSGDIAHELWDATDQVRARFAELFDLHATIHPDGSRDGYHFDLSANIPLEMEDNKPSGYDMVFSPSRGGHRG